MSENRQPQIKVMDKALDILELISEDANGLRLKDIIEKTGLNKTTAYRILTALTARQYLTKNEEGRYQIGNKLMEIISCYFSRVELQTESRPYLYQLSNRLHLSAILAVFLDKQSVLIDRMEYIQNYANYQTLGERPPLYCTAHGKLLLASMSSIELEYEMDRIQFEAFTPHTICDRDTLKRELREIRAKGYAMDDEERELNQRCIATCIYDYRGEAVAAITVSGSCVQIPDERLEKIIRELKDAAAKISARLGYFANN